MIGNAAYAQADALQQALDVARGVAFHAVADVGEVLPVFHLLAGGRCLHALDDRAVTGRQTDVVFRLGYFIPDAGCTLR